MARFPWLRGTGQRTTGRPTSANGASSFHLTWVLGPAPALVEVSAVLEVLVPPAVDSLYFWALQVGFADGAGDRGAAHVGLQWNARHRAGRAVNWGGYAPGGGLLAGTASALPSTPDDPNTRDYPWQPNRPYRLRVSPSPALPGHWQGEVTDLATGEATVIRHLETGGDTLTAPVVWSEVFARCDDPSVSVRWSGLEARTVAGEQITPRGLSVNYQARAVGGCDNTTVRIDGQGVVQTTNAERTVAGGRTISLDTLT
ncbi:MAG TPA: hypothetical protein VHM89_10345 [Acidimicrobiales bacterium]|nr:hypothetical protein [Acidimicrobiales bacterium]